MSDELFQIKQEFLHISNEYYEKVSRAKYMDLGLNEVHFLDAIGKVEKTNVTEIAVALNLTKGAVTKIAAKLLKKEHIRKFQREGNRKEVYFTLTDSGREIYELHLHRHLQLERNELEFLDQFSREEQAVVIDFFKKYSLYLDSKMDEDR